MGILAYFFIKTKVGEYCVGYGFYPYGNTKSLRPYFFYALLRPYFYLFMGEVPQSVGYHTYYIMSDRSGRLDTILTHLIPLPNIWTTTSKHQPNQQKCPKNPKKCWFLTVFCCLRRIFHPPQKSGATLLRKGSFGVIRIKARILGLIGVAKRTNRYIMCTVR